MEEENFLGEPSNSSNNRSLVNNNSSSANSINSTNSSGSNKPTSSSSLKQNSSIKLDETLVYDGEDVGWWDCSLCTYRNSADKFKCDICDLRRGTSTRKPRCNADTIVAQVVKQQEQIRQQTKVKTPKIRTSTSSGLNIATSSNESSAKYICKSTGSIIRPRVRGDKLNKNENTDDESDSEKSVSSPRVKKKKKTRDSKHEQRAERTTGDNDEDPSSSEVETTIYSSDESTSPKIHRSASETSLDSSHYSSSPAISPEPTAESPTPSTKTLNNPFKITPLEVTGNLIKYSPPTSSGRTGLIIDKKRFTQHSVTVNDVTITFTEFATRQNKYVRKKKKRRDATSKTKSNVGNGKSRAKSSNNASSTAATAEDT